MAAKYSHTFTALVICKANECRSVYAADLIRPFADAEGWQVKSAGTGAFPASLQCAESVSSRSSHHESRQVTAELIANADVILTMERSHRSRIAEILPDARFRTFTLSESAALAEFVLQAIQNPDSEFGDNRPAGFAKFSNSAKLQWLVTEMNEARGFIDPILDEILDAHGSNAIEHQIAFSQIETQVAALLGDFSRLLHTQLNPTESDN